MPYLATLKDDGWTLDDGEAAHAAHPDTFWIPDRQARHTLRPGDLAKLRFVLALVDEHGRREDAAERMWVEVETCDGGWYRGVLRNQPASTDEVLLGMDVWFEPRHVIDLVRGEARTADPP